MKTLSVDTSCLQTYRHWPQLSLPVTIRDMTFPTSKPISSTLLSLQWLYALSCSLSLLDLVSFFTQYFPSAFRYPHVYSIWKDIKTTFPPYYILPIYHPNHLFPSTNKLLESVFNFSTLSFHLWSLQSGICPPLHRNWIHRWPRWVISWAICSLLSFYSASGMVHCATFLKHLFCWHLYHTFSWFPFIFQASLS